MFKMIFIVKLENTVCRADKHLLFGPISDKHYRTSIARSCGDYVYKFESSEVRIIFALRVIQTCTFALRFIRTCKNSHHNHAMSIECNTNVIIGAAYKITKSTYQNSNYRCVNILFILRYSKPVVRLCRSVLRPSLVCRVRAVPSSCRSRTMGTGSRCSRRTS